MSVDQDSVVTIRSLAEAKEVYRSRDMRQACPKTSSASFCATRPTSTCPTIWCAGRSPFTSSPVRTPRRRRSPARLTTSLTWIESHPDDRGRAAVAAEWVQRCVHETVRLAPSSPIGMRRTLADVELRDGRRIPAGTEVIIDLVAINTDTDVYGADAASFNPDRALGADVPLHGLSFGHDAHACIGQELAAGVSASGGDGTAAQQWGPATVAVRSAFARGVDRDPDARPKIDSRTARLYWSRYPVVFKGADA